jgi:hypothetical protein
VVTTPDSDIVEYGGVRYRMFNGRILLNWGGSGERVPLAKTPGPCRKCARLASFKYQGRYVHKTCLEEEITAELRQGGGSR